MSKSIKIPLLPLRDIVAFPGMTIPLFVGRDKSIKSIETAVDYIFLVTQKNAETEEPKIGDLYKIGVVAKIKQAIVLHDKTVKILVEGETIATLEELSEDPETGILIANINVFQPATIKEETPESLALSKTLRSAFDQYSKAQKKYSAELSVYLETISDPFKLIYSIASHMELKGATKQEILEEQDPKKIIEKMLSIIESEMYVLQTERRIRSRIKSQIEKNQKEYYLNEQIKAIQKELGEGDDSKEEIARLEEKIKKTKLSAEAEEKAKSEVKKLKHMNPLSAEASVVRNYLDFLLALPWGKTTKINQNLESGKKLLDESHYGMEKAKDRIYELMIQRKRVENISTAPVLCFHGSPGTGKTSLANAAGTAMGLKTARISLAGVRDEAEIRGHRRTYIGAMPGKIMQAIKTAGSSSLLIILDEIGAIGQDWRGNPADALLEVLDPIQNKNFQDHYLEVGFDLSNIVFMATTNSLNLSPALLDRLEIIEISGYTLEEKQKIARNYIMPKLMKEHAIKMEQVTVPDSDIQNIIRHYTYESGVRNLERQLGTLIRKSMREFEEHKEIEHIDIDSEKVKQFLGKPTYRPEVREGEAAIGVATGLAWVEKREGQEGEVLYIEAKVIPGGSGKIECTGRLGEVMKESAEVAFKTMLSDYKKYDIDLAFIKEHNIHLHVPSGAVPKDGPSAGVAIFMAILSAVKNKAIRGDIAITGEISFWKVLKVGGIKEKILAAYRKEPKINTVFIPFDNADDLDDLSKDIRDSIEIVLVKSVDEIINKVFVEKL